MMQVQVHRFKSGSDYLKETRSNHLFFFHPAPNSLIFPVTLHNDVQITVQEGRHIINARITSFMYVLDCFYL